MQNYKDLEKNIEKDFSSVSSLETLQEFRLSYLGKKGKISLLMKGLSSLDADQRKENAEQLNILKGKILELIDTKDNELQELILNEKLETEKIDLTLNVESKHCLLYTSPSPRDQCLSRMPSSA